MKRIKFRAWDNILKEWWIEGATLWDLFAEVDDDVLFGELGSDRVKKRLVFLEYTGLKDSKGVEIYEGDIVEFSMPAEWDREQSMRLTGYVVFDYGGWWFRCIETSSYDGYLPEVGIVKVIGNIYEDKELLK